MRNPLARIALSLAGLALVVVSFVMMFQGQWLWGWLLIALAFACSWFARRV